MQIICEENVNRKSIYIYIYLYFLGYHIAFIFRYPSSMNHIPCTSVRSWPSAQDSTLLSILQDWWTALVFKCKTAKITHVVCNDHPVYHGHVEGKRSFLIFVYILQYRKANQEHTDGHLLLSVTDRKMTAHLNQMPNKWKCLANQTGW